MSDRIARAPLGHHADHCLGRDAAGLIAGGLLSEALGLELTLIVGGTGILSAGLWVVLTELGRALFQAKSTSTPT